jgi:hypothetical protein
MNGIDQGFDDMENKCTKCQINKPMHTYYDPINNPPQQFLCCECYVKAGNPPADWHPDCIKTYQELLMLKRLR